MLPLFLWAAYAVVREKAGVFLNLPLHSVEAGCALLGSSLMELCWKATAVFLVFGAVDLLRQIRRYNQDLRMSRQEIRDEFKEQEGNPQIKSRIRRLQRDRARKRMMTRGPDRHGGGGQSRLTSRSRIRYELDSMAAPVVVAKGKNYLALRIRQKGPYRTRCRWWRTRRWRRRYTNPWMSGRKSRRISTARWRRSWPTSSNS